MSLPPFMLELIKHRGRYETTRYIYTTAYIGDMVKIYRLDRLTNISQCIHSQKFNNVFSNHSTRVENK